MVTTKRLSRQKPASRREHIIGVATDAFLADGFAATSMSSIASLLGGSKATLYKYFATKEELFAAVVEQACSKTLAPLAESIDPRADVRKALIAHGERLLCALLDPAAIALHRVVQADGARFPVIAEAFYRSGPAQSYACLADYLVSQTSNGLALGLPPARAAEHLVSLLRGDLHLRATTGFGAVPDEAAIRRHVEDCVDLFLRGAGADT